ALPGVVAARAAPVIGPVIAPIVGGAPTTLGGRLPVRLVALAGVALAVAPVWVAWLQVHVLAPARAAGFGLVTWTIVWTVVLQASGKILLGVSTAVLAAPGIFLVAVALSGVVARVVVLAVAAPGIVALEASVHGVPPCASHTCGGPNRADHVWGIPGRKGRAGGR